jgi:hypothetical protein
MKVISTRAYFVVRKIVYLLGAWETFNLSGKSKRRGGTRAGRGMEVETMAKSDNTEKERSLKVVVHDEDAGGDPFIFHEGPGTPVETIIKQLYRKLETERNDGDRLVCIGSGESVFPHGDEHLGTYAETCTALEWGWSRKTGGA